jgi:hypothetical protein
MAKMDSVGQWSGARNDENSVTLAYRPDVVIQLSDRSEINIGFNADGPQTRFFSQ